MFGFLKNKKGQAAGGKPVESAPQPASQNPAPAAEEAAPEETAAITLTSAAWSGPRLRMNFSCDDPDLAAYEGSLLTLEAGEGAETRALATSHVAVEAKGAGLTLTGIINIADTLAAIGPDEALEARFWLAKPDGQRMALGSKRRKGMFWNFADGRCEADGALAIPDEQSGFAVIRLIGPEADLHEAEFARKKGGRPLRNALDLCALAGTPAQRQQGRTADAYTVTAWEPEGMTINLGGQALTVAPTPSDIAGWVSTTATTAKWQGGKLLVEATFDEPGLPLLAWCTPRLLATCPAFPEPVALPGTMLGTSLLATVDVAALCAMIPAEAFDTVVLKVTVDYPGGTTAGSCFGIKRADGVFGSFIDGFLLQGDALAIPDEAKNNALVLRLIGRESNPETSDIFRLRKRDNLANRLLMFAASQGAPAAFAMARGLDEGTLLTSLDFLDPEVATLCHCTVPGYEGTIDLDLDGLGIAKYADVLMQDREYGCLERNQNHIEQFTCLLDMVKEFDELCRAHDIQYYMCYGTLLGIIRHNGFIPWDHDVDLAMTRDNYLKLRAVFDRGEAAAGRFLEDRFTDEDVQEGFGRYFNTDTTRFNPEKPRGVGHRGKAGVFIDIFLLLPLEGTDPHKLLEQGEEFDAWASEQHTYSRITLQRDPLCFDYHQRLRQEIEERGRKVVMDEWCQRLYGKDEESASYYQMSSAGWPWPLIVPKRHFGEPVQRTVFGHDFPIPQNPPALMVALYGADWRCYPPDTTVYAEYNMFNCLNIPCAASVDFINGDVDEEALLARLTEKTQYAIQDAQERLPLHAALFGLGSVPARQQRDAVMAQAGKTLEQAVADKDWNLINRALQPYLTAKSLSCGNRVDVYLPLEPAWFLAMMTAQVSTCASLAAAYNMRLRRERVYRDIPLDPLEEQGIRLLVDTMRIRDLVEAGQFAEAQVLVDRVLAQAPDCIDAQAADLYMRALSCTDEAALSSLHQQACDRYARTGYQQHLFCAGFTAERMGKADRASLLYASLLARTRDVMVVNYCTAALEGMADHE